MRTNLEAPGGLQTITLHSSWLGIATSTIGAMIADVAAVAVAAVNGSSVISVLCALVAFASTMSVLFDMPIATTFDEDGFVRTTPLRRHRVRWHEIDCVDRPRSPIVLRVQRPGLVARHGHAQILLVDRMEGSREHERLRRVVGNHNEETKFNHLDQPPVNRTPTWIGRRSRWHPDA